MTVTRDSFEEWIAEELEEIAQCVDSLLTNSRVDPKDVDMVFLTGGSSFVPAVRRLFEDRSGNASFAAGMSLPRLLAGWL
jgi:hypothetical chaperone protein